VFPRKEEASFLDHPPNFNLVLRIHYRKHGRVELQTVAIIFPTQQPDRQCCGKNDQHHYSDTDAFTASVAHSCRIGCEPPRNSISKSVYILSHGSTMTTNSGESLPCRVWCLRQGPTIMFR